jgi:hypothetical protein
LTVLRLVQPEKAQSPTLVSEAGRAMLVRLVQPEKAFHPMFASADPVAKVTLARFLQYRKA